ncbi:cytochrome c oxidase assembly factor CtaG [Peribacillus butanolivorans]|uniref:cytochrome c oxidase assembly factor CtaG n=1 Tax=Peribacillus butanolivorans TaxID=421767 RepID=UPI002E22FC8F|nr:cytochrome c oxidase assembly factor CtaG [Peribacillus butanolivorans]
MSIDIFGFRALWSPYYFAALVLITVGYFLLVTKYRGKFRGSSSLSVKQTTFFLLAMFLLYMVKGSPLDLLSHIMFSAHMFQMALLYLVIPPLFIIAIPHGFWRSFIGSRGVKPLFQYFTKPLVALLLFNVLFSLYHIPLVFDFIKTGMWFHAGYTAILFTTAVLMWFPLVNQLPEQESLSGVKKVAYIFGSGILMTPACALIIFADYPMYDTFTNAESWASAMELCVPASALSNLSLSGPEMFNGLPLLEDQQLGGVLMKVIQEIVLGYVLGVIFFAWFKKENGEQNGIDPIPSEFQTVE